MKHNLPLSVKIVRGAIGKEYVIKHYKYGVIKTKYPDMTRIIASVQQRKCRDLFKDAVAYAKEVIADAERKRQWQKRIRRRNGVYNEAVKYYMLKDKRAREAAMLEANRLVRLALRNRDLEAPISMPTDHLHQSLKNQNKCETKKALPANKKVMVRFKRPF